MTAPFTGTPTRWRGFLRFWLLRQLYDGQAHIDQVVSALAGPAPSPVDNSAFHAERCSDHIATTPE